MQFYEGVPQVFEIRRQRRSLAVPLAPLLANGGDVVAQRATTRTGNRLRVLEVKSPVGGYGFEDAGIKFTRLAMKASTWSRMTGKAS